MEGYQVNGRVSNGSPGNLFRLREQTLKTVSFCDKMYIPAEIDASFEKAHIQHNFMLSVL